MSSDSAPPASWNTPERNPLYPLPIEPLPPDDPLLVPEEPTPAGAYRLDVGLKPIRTREELRSLLSVLTAIQHHMAALSPLNVQIGRHVTLNISDRITLDMIDKELTRAGFRDESIVLNTVPDSEISPI